MSERVTVDGLADAVKAQLDEYAGLASDEVKEAVRNTGKSVKEDIQEHAPVKTGAYRKSWAVKETSETADSLSVTVHSRTRYRLTHLLEHGHALRSGGRARVLFSVDDAIQDGVMTHSGERRLAATPPVVTGGSLIIPKGLLHQLVKDAEGATDADVALDRQGIEFAGMDAVMRIERSMGFIPKDVSADKCGYDVESQVPQALRAGNGGNALRLIEVKGRHRGVTEVTVSKHEIVTALNNPDDFILALVEVDEDGVVICWCFCLFLIVVVCSCLRGWRGVGSGRIVVSSACRVARPWRTMLP